MDEISKGHCCPICLRRQKIFTCAKCIDNTHTRERCNRLSRALEKRNKMMEMTSEHFNEPTTSTYESKKAHIEEINRRISNKKKSLEGKIAKLDNAKKNHKTLSTWICDTNKHLALRRKKQEDIKNQVCGLEKEINSYRALHASELFNDFCKLDNRLAQAYQNESLTMLLENAKVNSGAIAALLHLSRIYVWCIAQLCDLVLPYSIPLSAPTFVKSLQFSNCECLRLIADIVFAADLLCTNSNTCDVSPFHNALSKMKRLQFKQKYHGSVSDTMLMQWQKLEPVLSWALDPISSTDKTVAKQALILTGCRQIRADVEVNDKRHFQDDWEYVGYYDMDNLSNNTNALSMINTPASPTPSILSSASMSVFGVLGQKSKRKP